jgi:hypothetical protein
LEPVGKLIKKLAAEREDLRLTKTQLKRANAIELVRTQQQIGRPELLYAARPFLLCGLPLRQPPKDQLTHSRKNGRFFLQVFGHPDFGLPFGQDRLVPIWVATQAIRLRSREFSFDSGHQILTELGLARNGKNYRRLMAGFKRVFMSSIVFGTDELTNHAPTFEYQKVSFFDHVKLWAPQLGGAPSAAHENTIKLTEAFWAEISAHPIPVDADVVRALANSPGALDFYMWLRWRSFGCKVEIHIALAGRGGLAEQLGAEQYGRARDFRRTIARYLETVRDFWPECPASLCRARPVLTVRPERVILTGL